jgi:hypothetical protein
MIKSILLSAAAMIIAVGFVFGSSAVSTHILNRLEDRIAEANTAEDYKAFNEEYMKLEKYFSLTMPDSALSEIESTIGELISFSECGSDDEAMAAKNRLCSQIKQQRRLSGFNLRSIF